ncbi:MAG: TIGR00159 family protein [Flavobacteriaceae bacterium TMED179]|nr:MAG: TIGR00159 family protein [Flavobacteriaceae bacterium TMED179]
MNITDFINFSFVDVIDIFLVALLLFYLYKLVQGTVAINIFIGIVIIYLIWKLTDLLNMDVLSNLLGKFISVGFFALIVVFQEEIRKFLLLLGSTNFTNKRNVVRYFKFLSQTRESLDLNLNILLNSCEEMSKNKVGAIIVLQKNNSLDFTLKEGNQTNIQLTPQVLESIFFKNSPLHDGAIVIENNIITATRVVLPVSDRSDIPSGYGLRHRAALGITEKTDALVLVISEQTGKIVYVKNGSFIAFETSDKLKKLISQDLSG